jgi:hypothetical protein
MEGDQVMNCNNTIARELERSKEKMRKPMDVRTEGSEYALWSEKLGKPPRRKRMQGEG